eukprot:GHVR01170826.1.p1 GENE.GHVR01170826.1~~GHVR01170826.1.p1  ORF type:complete len:237 (+),score=41.06 GHVR01170826.1:38-748(+)
MTEYPSEFECPICLDAFYNPVTLPSCSHTFCESCLNVQMLAQQQSQQKKQSSPTSHSTYEVVCPVCRCIHKTEDSTGRCQLRYEGEGPLTKWRDTMMISKMSKYTVQCICSETLRLDMLSEHQRRCVCCRGGDVVSSMNGLLHSCNKGYPCPYCECGDYDCRGLLTHLDSVHQGVDDPAVCPVCVCMPQGDPTHVCMKFATHMRTRHRLDPEEYVLDDDSEEAAIQRVIEMSLLLT